MASPLNHILGGPIRWPPMYRYSSSAHPCHRHMDYYRRLPQNCRRIVFRVGRFSVFSHIIHAPVAIHVYAPNYQRVDHPVIERVVRMKCVAEWLCGAAVTAYLEHTSPAQDHIFHVIIDSFRGHFGDRDVGIVSRPWFVQLQQRNIVSEIFCKIFWHQDFLNSSLDCIFDMD